MFRRLQGSNDKFRCIQHCDTLNLQNNACLCNHFRLTVNIPNKRFLISDFWTSLGQNEIVFRWSALFKGASKLHWEIASRAFQYLRLFLKQKSRIYVNMFNYKLYHINEYRFAIFSSITPNFI